MKRTILILSLLVLIISLALVSTNVKPVSAQNDEYTIQSVSHQIELLYSANVIVRDTITLSGEATNSFVIGFPYQYSGYILKGLAFGEAGPLPVKLGVQVGNRSGFYGVEITTPQTPPQTFTVVFILSNEAVTRTASGYNLDFPAYPSFTKDATQCNVAISLPNGTSGIAISKADGNISATSYAKENLPAYTNSPAKLSFDAPVGVIQKMDVDSLIRVLTVYPAGEIRVMDSFRIANTAPDLMGSVRLNFPSEASNVIGKDSFGRTLSSSLLEEMGSVSSAVFTLQNSIGPGQTAIITTEYSMPTADRGQNTRFSFGLAVFPVMNYFVEDASLTVVPPEGAHFTSPQISGLETGLAISRELFQETILIQQKGISYVDSTVASETSFQVTIDYNPIWLSLRPTLGVWALSIVGSILLSVWRRPKSPGVKRTVVPRLSAGLSPDNVRAFVEAYEERRTITHELRVLHARGQKGKIPRNYYKSQRRNLESHLDALSKDISQLKETFRNAGAKFGDLIRQLDASEKEMAKSRAKIREAEARHRTGEMKIEEYKKALADYQRQKEKLEQQINGTLLRLREEIQ